MEKDEVRYGIYSDVSRKFVFGISEPSKTKAWKALEKKIGNDSRKWRFRAKKLPPQPKEISQKELDEVADKIITALKEHGVVIQRYDSYSSKSIYLKFDYGVLNSLRISDHHSKKTYLSYRYNLLGNIKQRYMETDSKGYERYYAPLEEVQVIIDTILFHRNGKLSQYGWDNYSKFMERNREHNIGNEIGFWAQAKLV